MADYIDGLQIGTNGTAVPLRDTGARELIANCAPAGYGLGESIPGTTVRTLAEIDGVMASGFYRIANLKTTLNGVWVNHASLTVYTIYNGECVQEIRPLETNYMLRRCRYNNTWSEWECDNPPMVVGVEYRLIERYNGYPVYAKVVNCGTPSNEKAVNVPGVSIFRHTGNFNNDHTIPFGIPSDTYFANSHVSSGVTLCLACSAAFVSDSYIWYEHIWYTK